jgi:hypothetical protein
MNAYHLKLYGPKVNSIGARNCVGEYDFTAVDNQAAVAQSADTYSEGLSGSSYAALYQEGIARPVWEKGHWSG